MLVPLVNHMLVPLVNHMLVPLVKRGKFRNQRLTVKDPAVITRKGSPARKIEFGICLLSINNEVSLLINKSVSLGHSDQPLSSDRAMFIHTS